MKAEKKLQANALSAEFKGKKMKKDELIFFNNSLCFG